MLAAVVTHAQVDRSFWFAAPYLTTSHTPDNINLVIVAYDEAATVSISQPAAGRTLLAARRVNAHSTFTFSLRNQNNYKQNIETRADGQVHNTGILITSDADITAYYATTAPNSEVYALKGAHGLGTHFVVPQQWRHACNHTDGAYASIEVVATEDNTTVTIDCPVATNVNATPGTVTVTLNRGESYALRSRTANTPANEHLGGTIVTADKPVAVNTSDDSATTGNDKDLIGEQLVPVDLAGSRYILPANNSNNHEYAYLYAIDSATTVNYTTDGVNVTSVNIAPGAPREVPLNNIVATLFYSDDNSPFILFHLTANEGGNELSGTILPSLNCSGSQEVNYVPALSEREAKVTILTRTENIDGFIVNDSPYELPAASFRPVAGDSTWSYCSCANLTLAYNYQSFNITNNKGVFHLGILDNGGGACSYGFFSNFGHISLFAHSGENIYYVGDTLRLSLTGGDGYENIVWHGPHGDFGFNDPAPFIAPLTSGDGGMYTVSAVHKEGCDVLPDSIYVSVFETSDRSKRRICTGDTITLQAVGIKPFRWYADGVLLADSTERTLTVSPSSSVTYSSEHGSRGASLVTWTDTTDLPVQEGDSVLLWNRQMNNLIPGATYRWRITLFASENNSVAPKLLFIAGDSISPLTALPNGTGGLTLSINYTVPVMPYPEDYNAGAEPELRIVALACHSTQHIAIRSMTFYPVIQMTEDITVVAEACKECPVWETVSDLGSFCSLTEIVVPVNVISGEIDTFSVRFSAEAEAAGFVSMSGLTLTGDSIRIPVNVSPEPGKYSLRLFTADSICSEVGYDISFELLTLKACTDCAEWQTVSSLGSFCSLTALSIPVDVTAGEVQTFDVRFSAEAEAAGFVSMSGLTLTGDSLLIPVTGSPGPGRYTLTVSTTDPICGDISYEVSFELLTPIECTDCATWQALDNLGELCDSKAIDIPITVTEGELAAFVVTFSAEAKVAGFTDTIISSLQAGSIVLPLPDAPKAGCYSLTIRTNHDICGSHEEQVTFCVLYPAGVIAQRWNDILFVMNKDYNGGYDFVAFRWYRNGEPMDVEERSWLYEQETFRPGDYYQALLTEADGRQSLTCPFYPSTTQQPMTIQEQGTQQIYYNLSGIQISEPTSPGIYILRRGILTEKIIR